MEKRILNEFTPLLMGVDNRVFHNDSNSNSDEFIMNTSETEITQEVKENRQNTSVATFASDDYDTAFVRDCRNKDKQIIEYNNARLEGDERENRPSLCRPLLVKPNNGFSKHQSNKIKERVIVRKKTVASTFIDKEDCSVIINALNNISDLYSHLMNKQQKIDEDNDDDDNDNNNSNVSDGVDRENQQSNRKPFMNKVDHGFSTEQKIDNNGRIFIAFGNRRITANCKNKGGSRMISNGVNDCSQLNICLNKNSKGSVSCSLLKPLEDYSKCELITLTLKHMFKVFFTTLPVIISVCLTGFGLSKLPYTNSCTKNVTDTSCAYYNKLILFGVNRVVRLVSTWYIIFVILLAFQVVTRVKIAAT